MNDPENPFTFTAVIAGRSRRFSSSKLLRVAISNGDILRETLVDCVDSDGATRSCRAAEHPVLAALFDELLGPAPAEPAPASAAPAPTPAKPSASAAAAQAIAAPSAPRAAPAPLAPRRDVAPLLPQRTEEPAQPDPPEPQTNYLAWALVLAAGFGLLSFMGSDDPAASPEDTSAADAAAAASAAAIAAAAEAAPTPTDPQPTAEPSKPSNEEARKREQERELVRERKRIADALRDARRKPTRTPQPTETAAPPPPKASMAKAAKPRGQGSWAGQISRNYPTRALNQGIEGRVSLSVVIGGDGRVQSCTVTASSGAAILDRAACEGMRRYARFDPALDADGYPTEGSFSTSIAYQIAE